MRILMVDSHRAYGITEYVVDTQEDLDTVPKRNEGDICRICSTGQQKILAIKNKQLEWVDAPFELTLLND